MRILVCGEGKHEIGMPNKWCEKTKDYISVEGWMQPLIRAIKGRGIDFSVRRRSDLILLPKDRLKVRPLPVGHGAKALMAKRIAVVEGFDAVVFMVDADSTDVRRWREIDAEIQDGFARIPQEIPSIACIPMSASESWLLSDSEAWLLVTGNDAVPIPKQPEKIWGERDDPDADHPHSLFARLCDGCQAPDGHALRLDLAQKLNLETLLQKCPISFRPFYDALKAA